ncbi:MAG: hypothetical protein IKC32_05885 [Clostridia bacterium]|nr:hypothetical protein [Clostridia bacterium]
MKKFVSMLLVLAMISCVAFSLAGCGAPEDDGAHISVYLGNEVYDFDPTDYYVDSNAEQLMSLLFEPLFKLEKGKLVNGVAESYKVDRELRKIVITLRETYWSNNTRVKAADFVYAWSERLLNPNNANPAAALLYDIENAAGIKSGTLSPAELKAEATDVYELTITYREGADYEQLLRNLASVATAPIRQSAAETAINYWSKVITSVVTNGPFRVANYDTLESALVLARNNGYHQPYDVENYVTKVTPGMLVGFTTAIGDTVEVSYSDITDKTVFYLADAPLSERLANKDKAVVADDTSVYTYVFNTERELFKIPEVRLALSLAIDRQAIIDAIGFGKAADGFVPDVSGGSSADLIAKTAKTLEAEALLADVDFTGINKSFTLTVAADEESLKIAELVKGAWDALGFNVKIESETVISNTVGSDEDTFEILDSGIQAAVKRASLGERDFDVIAVDWQTYTDDAFVALASLSGHMNGCGRVLPDGGARTSITGWADEDYDYYISAAYKSSGEERAAALASAEAYLCEEMPVIPLVFNQSFAFVSSELSGVTFDSLGNAVLTRVSQKNYKNYLEE